MVGSAADGAEAVQLARAHIPDVAILEMKMRGMDGIQALRAIREASPNTRTIVFTGDISRKALREAIRAGAHAVLLKRSAAELSAAVRRVLAGERFVNECALKAAFSPEIGASRSSLS